MKTNIIVFGQLTDIIGNDKLVVNNAGDTNSLLEELKKGYPALEDSKFILAVDKKLVTENTLLNTNSTIALMPPFSGG